MPVFSIIIDTWILICVVWEFAHVLEEAISICEVTGLMIVFSNPLYQAPYYIYEEG